MQRVRYIDFMKGIGILLVILGHMQKLISSKLLFIIYTFHIPLFYFISGNLYQKKYDKLNKKDYFKKISKSLLYPYFTLFMINMIYGILKYGLNRLPKYILSFIYSNYIFDSNYVGAVWFLCSLFVVEVLFFIIHNSKYKKVLICISIIIGIIMKYIVTVYGFRFPFWIDISIFGLLFYSFGFMIKNKNINIYHIFISIIIYMISIFLNVRFFSEFMLNGHFDLLYLKIGCSLFYILSAMSAIVIVLYVCKKIGKCLLIESFGKNSLIIMGLHIIILQIVTKIIICLKLTSHFSILIIFTLTSSLTLICSILMNKYLKFLIKVDRR